MMIHIPIVTFITFSCKGTGILHLVRCHIHTQITRNLLEHPQLHIDPIDMQKLTNKNRPARLYRFTDTMRCTDPVNIVEVGTRITTLDKCLPAFFCLPVISRIIMKIIDLTSFCFSKSRIITHKHMRPCFFSTETAVSQKLITQFIFPRCTHMTAFNAPRLVDRRDNHNTRMVMKPFKHTIQLTIISFLPSWFLRCSIEISRMLCPYQLSPSITFIIPKRFILLNMHTRKIISISHRTINIITDRSPSALFSFCIQTAICINTKCIVTLI